MIRQAIAESEEMERVR